MAESFEAAPSYPRLANLSQPIVWITSFPKSGNTWTRILFASLLQEGKSSADELIALTGLISADRPIFDNATGLASSDMTSEEIDLLRPGAYRHLAGGRSEPLFIKAHDAFQRNAAGTDIFPADCTRGALLIVRHPMDVALSLAHHLGDADCERATHRLGSETYAMAGMGRPQYHQLSMGWSGHYLSWTRQDAIPVLVVRYEDLLADTPAVFARMLDFLGMPGSRDQEDIERAVSASSFDRLQRIEEQKGFPEIPVGMGRFFRSGRAGEGIKALPAHLRRRILDDHTAVMEELGYSQEGVESL